MEKNIVRNIFRESKYIAKNYEHYQEIDSTNNELKRRINSSPEKAIGTLISTDYQTNGRGRFDRKWQSQKAKSLMFSFAFCPKIDDEQVGLLGMISALAIHEVLKGYGIRSQIKWPNDIIIDTKKCCGILCETIRTKKLFSIIGIGLNINQSQSDFSSPELENAISLEIATGKEYDKNEILKSFITTFENFYEELIQSFDRLKERIEDVFYLTGKQIIKDGKKGTVIGIDYKGFLVIQSGNQYFKLTDGDFGICYL